MKSINSSEQLSIRRGQLEKIHIALFLSKILVVLTMASWETLIPKKTSFWTHIWIYWKISKTLFRAFRKFGNYFTVRKQMHFRECNWSTWTFTPLIISRRAWYKTYCTCSWNVEKSSSKGFIHFSYGDTDVLLATLAHLYKDEKEFTKSIARTI